MKRKWFKKITKEDIERCEKIKKDKSCVKVKCEECPFRAWNLISSPEIDSCVDIVGEGFSFGENSMLEPAVRKFIKKFSKDFEDPIQEKFEFIKKYVEENDKNWKADWSNRNQPKHIIYYRYSNCEWDTEYVFEVRRDRLYMSKGCSEKLSEILNSK